MAHSTQSQRLPVGMAMLPLSVLPIIACFAYVLPMGGAVTLIAISVPVTIAAALLTLTFAEARTRRRDITSLETELATVRERSVELDTVVAKLHEGVVVVDVESHAVTFTSARAAELIGNHASLPAALCAGIAPTPQRRTSDRLHPDGAPFQAVIAGRHIDCTLHAMPALDGRRRLAIILADGTERHRQAMRFSHLRSHDRITGLIDRDALRRTLASRLDTRDVDGALALLLLDIDGFRTINARVGEHVGDRVLAAFGRRLQRIVRATDVVARVDGDMFAIIQSNASEPRHVQPLADRLRDELAKPMLVDDVEVELPVTIGAALAPLANLGLTADHLLAQAEVALMEAKAVDGGQFRLHSDSE